MANHNKYLQSNFEFIKEEERNKDQYSGLAIGTRYDGSSTEMGYSRK
jgi:hypothetical protein